MTSGDLYRIPCPYPDCDGDIRDVWDGEIPEEGDFLTCDKCGQEAEVHEVDHHVEIYVDVKP
jgi:hypothetical protein